MVNPVRVERRRRRSDDPDVAARFQLEQVLKDFHLELCVLVDDSGQLIGHPGEETDLGRALAKAAPKVACGSDHDAVFEELREHADIGADDVSACEFRTNGRRFYVAALGDKPTMRDVGMFRAILGIRRIKKEAG